MKWITREHPRVETILDGIRVLHHPNDQAQRKASYPVLDALYAYCKARETR